MKAKEAHFSVAMKHVLLFIFTSAFSIYTFSQEHAKSYDIGNYIDINRFFFFGYYDFEYNPSINLKIRSSASGSYLPGYYYDNKNNKINGYLTFGSFFTPSIYFKHTLRQNYKILKTDSIKAFVSGADSFVIISYVKTKRKSNQNETKQKCIARYIDRIGDFTFWMNEKEGWNGPIYTFMVKSEKTNEVISIPKSKQEFKEVLTTYFKDYEYLVRGLKRGDFRYDDIPSMIKLMKYKLKFNNQEKLYFNESWKETESKNEAVYYAEIESIKDSLFHLKYYFMCGTPIFSGSYTSFYPNIKQGTFEWYHADGRLYKKAEYVNNKVLDSTYIYFTSGAIHYKLGTYFSKTVFLAVYDSSGQSILDIDGDGRETFYDVTLKRYVSREYKNNSMINSWYITESGGKVYQLCKKNASFDMKYKVETCLSQNIDSPESKIKTGIQGIMLIKCIIKPNGLVSEMQLIKGLHPESDSVVLSVLEMMKVNKLWNPAWVNGHKVLQEVVIPVVYFSGNHSSDKNSFWTSFLINQAISSQTKFIRSSLLF